MKKYLINFTIFIVFLLSFTIVRNNPQTKKVKTQASEVLSSSSASISAVLSPTITVENITPTPNIRPIYIGMWTQGFWDDNNKSLNTEHLTQLEQKIGKKFAIAHYYRGWDALQTDSIVNELNAISSNGWRPMLSANPYFFSDCAWTEKGLYKTIAEGECDGFLKRAATNLKRFTKPMFFRFAWEMNLPANEWGMKNTNNTPEDYIKAWRHMHDIFVGEGATNLLWVFCPNSSTPDSVPYSQLYPGDAYVDWTGIDVYNWGDTQSWSSWQSFSTLFKPSYNQILGVAPGKPLMIAEINSANTNGNKVEWYSDLLNTQLPYNFPAVKAVVFYNEDRTAKEHVNWLIDISQESLNSFKQGIQNPYYISSF